MSAERMPQEETSLLAQPLGLVTRLVVRWPRATLGAAIVLAAGSLFLTAALLDFHTSRLDLLNPQSGYNKLWLDYIGEFGDEDDTVIVVEGESREQVISAVEHVAAEVARRQRSFHAVLHKIHLERLHGKQLHYLSLPQLHGIEQYLDQIQPIAGGDWSGLNLGKLIARLSAGAAEAQPAAAQALAHHLANVQAALAESGGYRSPWSALGSGTGEQNPFQSQYLLAGDGRIGLVLLRLSDDGKSFDRGSQAIDELRQLLGELGEQHPGVRLGLTGLPVMENDEMRISQSSTIRASLLSLVGVVFLFAAGFGGLKHPLMTVATLIVALAWSFGYATLAVGHLNILSMSFGVMLIGLGIDFGVHYVARYLHLRQTVHESGTALVQTAHGVGPGIVTGGATTAIAFFAGGLTDFTGVAELGIIAGGGVLLCIVAALVVLPAMIHLADRERPGDALPQPLAVNSWIGAAQRIPRTAMAGSLLITALAGLGLGRLWYDHNLLNLQPVALESVELEERLLSQSDQSVWFALSIADTPEELLARKEKFLQLDCVKRTEEIVSLLPPDEEGKGPIIARIRLRLASLAEEPPLIPVDSPAELARMLVEAQSRLGPHAAAGLGREAWQPILAALHDQPLGECYRRLSQYQQQMAGDLLARLRAIREISDPAPPRLSDLPPSLVTRFVGRSGQHLLKIYSTVGIWDMDKLETFVDEVRRVDPQATGKPLQTFEASRQMQRSYVHAALYALIGISMVLVLDFRSIGYSLLALLPVGLGMTQMFGLLGLLDIPLNPANMIVLPLLLGIGLDDGVHVIHDFRCQSGPYRLSRSTATAVLITSLTTMVGFGCLMMADHRGLQSLGRVLVIGVSCCLFTSLVPVPALLAWITRNRPEKPGEMDTPAGPREHAAAGRDGASGRNQQKVDLAMPIH